MGVFDGYAGDMQQQAAARPMPQAQPRGGGGLGGFLFNSFIKPTVNTVAGLPSGLMHGVQGVGIAGKSVLSGEHGAAAQKSKQQALNQFNQIPMFKGVLPNTVAGVRSQNLGTQAEKFGGTAASNLLNVAGPEDVALKQGAKMGLKQLAGQGIKSGIKYGAAGGAANSMSQGQTGGQVVNSALLGGATGGAVGLAGGTLGAGVGKLAGKRAGKSAAQETMGVLQPSGFHPIRNAAIRTGNQAAAETNAAVAHNVAAGAQNTFNDHIAPFQGVDSRILMNHDLAGTQDFLRGIGVEPTVANMHAVADVTTGKNGLLSNTMRQILDNTDRVSVENVMPSVHDAIGQAGVGDSRAKGTVARDVASSINSLLNAHLKSSLDVMGRPGGKGEQMAGANNTFNAIQAMEAKMRTLGQSDKDMAMREGLSAAKTALEDSLANHAGVNRAISEAHLASTGPGSEEQVRTAIAAKGLPKEVADYLVNGINNTKGNQAFQELRGLQKPAVNASMLAHAADNYAKGPGVIKTAQGELGNVQDAAKTAAQEAKPAGMDNGMGGLANVYEGAAALRGNVPAMGALAAKATRTNPMQRLLGGLAPGVQQEAYQAAVKTPEQMAAEAAGTTTVPVPEAPGGSQMGGSNPLALTTGKQRGVQGAMGALTGATAVGTGNLSNQMLTNPQQSQQAPTSGPTDQSQMAGNDTSQMPDMSNANNNSMYGAANMMADIQRDPKNASTYMQLYKMMNPTQSASATTIKPNAQQYGEATSGLQSLQQLQDMIGKNPNIVNQTAVPGQGLPLVGGMIRNAAGTGDYQAAAQNTLDALARARTGAAMSKQEEAFYQRMLPQAGDSPDTIDFKLKQLQTAFQPFLQINQSQPQDMSQLTGATQ